MNTTETSVPVTLEWNGRKYGFPKDRYILRCQTAVFKTSKSGNPMIEFGWEIVGTKEGGETIKCKLSSDPEVPAVNLIIVGATVPNWLAFTSASESNVRDFEKMMGFQPFTLNGEAPDMSLFTPESPEDVIYINAIVYAQKSIELSDDIDEVTGKQKPILDDDDKPIVKNFLRMGDIISRNYKFKAKNPI